MVRILSNLPTLVPAEASDPPRYETMALNVLTVTLNILRGDNDTQVHCGFVQPLPDVCAKIYQSLQPDQTQEAA